MRNQRGITLIALVITIVVMLILAGVTITTAMGNGVIEKSAGAQKEGNKQAERERLAIYIQGHYLNNYSNSISDESEVLDLNTLIPEATELSEATGGKAVQINATGIIYGDNYYLIRSGTSISGFGTTEFDYVFNINTGDLYLIEDYQMIDV